ncbi:YusW family protein [Natribacillus halophilus]|uniref:YusW-like protein n=1 Tax=Natribacillus halophilus TaxID=549003 RepID=A0A1G8QCH3_9BACI|nr:YusW family protein [Natribacillus halophilus]SDJ02308.1 YusW-like protein [Natribacillus halophilus]
MKKFMIATGCVAAISLSAVGFSQFSASAGGDESPNDAGEAPSQAEEPTVQAENAGDDWFESLPFKEFELDVEYDDDAEYDADYEHEGGAPEAEIEEERDGKEIEISGDEALNELSGILPNMDIDENTNREEIINAALDAFELDSNYKELEIDIEFLDGQEMEIEEG